MTPIDFGVTRLKVKVRGGICVVRHFLFMNDLINLYKLFYFYDNIMDAFKHYVGPGKWSMLGSSGASHGGLGGRGGCGSYTTCRLARSMPYGDLYLPNQHGSGGALSNGGTG